MYIYIYKVEIFQFYFSSELALKSTHTYFWAVDNNYALFITVHTITVQNTVTLLTKAMLKCTQQFPSSYQMEKK